MSEYFLTDVAQFLYLLWPVFILAALFFAFQGIHFRRKTSWLARIGAIAARIRFDLFATWTFLFLVWMVTLFASGPNNTILPEPLNSLVFFGGYALIAALEIGPRVVSAMRAQLSLHRSRSLNDLKNMDPYRFEDLVTATYRGLGYKATHIGHSGDHGVDVELTTRGGEFWIVQCKRYHGSVGESIVRELYGTMVSEGARRAILVTTAEITPPAETWARGKPIDLVDGPRLLDLIDAARRRREGSLFGRLARWWLLTRGQPPAPIWHPPAATTPRGLPEPWTPSATASPGAAAPGATVPGTTAAPGAAVPGATAVPGAAASRRIDPVPRPRSAGEHTQPVQVARPVTASEDGGWQPATAGERTVAHHNGSAPICPVCGVRMVRRPPRPSDRPGRVLYRCRNYPACRVVLDR